MLFDKHCLIEKLELLIFRRDFVIFTSLFRSTYLTYSKYLLNQAFDLVVLQSNPCQQSFGKLGTFHAIQAMEQCNFHGIYAEDKIKSIRNFKRVNIDQCLPCMVVSVRFPFVQNHPSKRNIVAFG